MVKQLEHGVVKMPTLLVGEHLPILHENVVVNVPFDNFQTAEGNNPFIETFKDAAPRITRIIGPEEMERLFGLSDENLHAITLARVTRINDCVEYSGYKHGRCDNIDYLRDWLKNFMENTSEARDLDDLIRRIKKFKNWQTPLMNAAIGGMVFFVKNGREIYRNPETYTHIAKVGRGLQFLKPFSILTDAQFDMLMELYAPTENEVVIDVKSAKQASAVQDIRSIAKRLFRNIFKKD